MCVCVHAMHVITISLHMRELVSHVCMARLLFHLVCGGRKMAFSATTKNEKRKIWSHKTIRESMHRNEATVYNIFVKSMTLIIMTLD